MNQLVTVLTGGIASGKTQVSNVLSDLDCAVIDADIVARQVVAKDTVGWSAIVKRFGQELLQQDGEINRQTLRKIVFNDADALADLNAITHPLITKQIKQNLDNISKQVVVVVVPLLTTANRHDYFDRVLVVDVCSKIQQQRLQLRDSIDSKLAKKMLASQISREQRLFLADDVIVNDRSLIDLKRSTELMHGYYQSLVA